MTPDVFTLEPLGWFIFILSGIMIGMEKGGIAGLTIIVVPLMASIFPPTYSVGILLPMLLFGDLLGIYHFRKHVLYKEVLKSLPLVVTGIFAGYLFLKYGNFSDITLKKLIGIIVLFMLAFSEWQKRKNSGVLPKANIAIMCFLGVMGGATSMVANAAGPVMVLYLLYLGLSKEQFMGVRAWMFIIINSIKVPLHIELGNITLESLSWNLKLIPAVIAGFIIGAFILKKIPQDTFTKIIKILAILACLKLII